MKALTLWRPWDQAICPLSELPPGVAPKRIENRPRPPGCYGLRTGERFALHAGKRRDTAAEVWLMAKGVPIASCDDGGEVFAVATLAGAYSHAHGDRVPNDQAMWFFGPWGFLLVDVVALEERVFCRGHQGGWNLRPDVEARVRRQLP